MAINYDYDNRYSGSYSPQQQQEAESQALAGYAPQGPDPAQAVTGYATDKAVDYGTDWIAKNVFGAGHATVGQALSNPSGGFLGPGGDPGALLPGGGVGSEISAPFSPSPFSISNFGAEGNVLAPAAGAVGAWDLFTNKHSRGRDVAQGAASGAAIGSYFGPEGALIGGGIGAGVGLTKSFFDGPPKTEVEDKRTRKLGESGVTGFDKNAHFTALGADEQLKQNIAAGLSQDFVGAVPGGWVNNQFLSSGNEGDLRPEDIIGYSAFGEKYGNDWFGKFTPSQRIAIAGELLKAGGVREHHGTVDLTFTPETDDAINKIISGETKIPDWVDQGAALQAGQTAPAAAAPTIIIQGGGGGGFDAAAAAEIARQQQEDERKKAISLSLLGQHTARLESSPWSQFLPGAAKSFIPGQ